MSIQKIVLSAIVAACGAVPATATLTTYCVPGPYCSGGSNSNASSEFSTATSSDTFSDINVTQGSLGDSYTDSSGLIFSDSLGLLGTSNPSGWPTGTAIAGSSGSNGTTLTVTLPSSVDAIEFYVGMQDFSNFTISVTDNSGGTFSSGWFAQTNVSVPQFFGVTTDSYFTSFTITSQASPDKITLDDIMIGSSGASDPSPAPEATTLLLVGTGMFLMGYIRRRTYAASRGTVRTMSTGITPA
jgi:hypothetical protein